MPTPKLFLLAFVGFVAFFAMVDHFTAVDDTSNEIPGTDFLSVLTPYELAALSELKNDGSDVRSLSSEDVSAIRYAGMSAGVDTMPKWSYLVDGMTKIMRERGTAFSKKNSPTVDRARAMDEYDGMRYGAMLYSKRLEAGKYQHSLAYTNRNFENLVASGDIERSRSDGSPLLLRGNSE